MNGSHMPPSNNGPGFEEFITDVHAYASDPNSYENLGTLSFDPALFTSSGTDSSYPPPNQGQVASYNHAEASRQSTKSPAIPTYQPSPSPGPYQYPHGYYQERNLAPPMFDSSYMHRPSPAPSPFRPIAQHAMNQNSQQYRPLEPAYPSRPPPSTQNGLYQFQQQQQQQHQQHQQHQQAHHQQPQWMQFQNPPNTQYAQAPRSENIHYQPLVASPANQAGSINPAQVMFNDNIPVANDPNVGMQQFHQGTPQYQQSPYFNSASSRVETSLLPQIQQRNLTPIPQQHPNLQAGQHIISPSAPIGQSSQASSLLSKTKARPSKPKSDELASDDDLEIEPETIPAILTASAPIDERGKVLYETVKAVWTPRNKIAPTEAVRTGIAAFGEIVRSLRDAWKLKNEALKKAELPDSPTAAMALQLRSDVAQYRQTVELVMQQSISFGHPSILSRLGDNQFTLSALYSFLLDRANAGDHDSTLVTSIFKLAVYFTTVDEKTLESLKWSKILQRFSKKATNDSKDFAKKILLNAAQTTIRKKEAKSDGDPGSPNSKGIKRGREGDSQSSVPKKIVRPASKPLALQHAERRKALEKEKASKDVTAKTATSASATRPKVTVAVPHKTNAFAGLLSAKKKPGTSNAEKAAAAAAAVAVAKDGVKTIGAETIADGPTATTKIEEVKRDSPPRTSGLAVSKPSSSFLGFLADMDKPKPEVKKVEVNPDENPEDRAKRIRKESRKRLRVSWKADNELVETRLFTHDPEEETGHADSMMRDAGDTGKEGEMLKLHKGIEDLDDDEDDDEDVVGENSAYSSPSEVDFSVIPEGDREGNYIKTAGSLTAESSAKETQDKFEKTTLMVIYTTGTDRPDAPKELPSVEEEDDFSPSVDFGDPVETFPEVRKREKDILASQQQESEPQQQNYPVAQNGGADLAAQLRAITQQQMQPQPTFDLQRVLSTLGQHNQQAPSQPVQPTSGQLDLSKLFAVVQQHSQMQQAQHQPQYQQPHSGPTLTPNLAALVAQVTSNHQNASLSLGESSNPNPYPGGDSSRKHGRADSDGDVGGKKKKKVPLDESGKPLNYKTQVCSFWVEGKCRKGEDCTYRHDED